MFELVVTFFNLSISDVHISDFKLAKSIFLANFNVSTPVAFSKSAFFWIMRQIYFNVYSSYGKY